jgi:hypothetical protein
MSLRQPSVALSQIWRTQDALSRCVIALSMLLVVFAYLPTLRQDYVPLDQWRTFRYQILSQSPLARLKACAATIAPYYSRTGRPLLWLPECVEHAAVARTSDFVYLRPLALVIALIACAYLGTVLAPFVGGLAMGVIAASAFAMSPPYAFMYLQGLTGAAVVVCIVLAAASFRLVRAWLDDADGSSKPGRRKLIAALALFFIGCLSYPAWMFAVVPLSLLAAGADIQRSRSAMVKRLCATLAFYAFAALVYFLFERLIETVLQTSTHVVPDMGDYSLSLHATRGELLYRAREAAMQFARMPPLNFEAARGLMPLALGLFCAGIAWNDGLRDRGHLGASLALGLAVFAAGCVILLGSIAPWLLSSVANLATRFILPWYLFFCAAVVAVAGVLVGALAPRLRQVAPVAALLIFVVPVAIRQERLSTLETRVSDLEIQTMRAALAGWLQAKGYERQRYLLVVRPFVLRPPFAELIVGKEDSAGENARLASAQNPAVVAWMIIALLRERQDHPVGRSVGLEWCATDQACVERVLHDQHSVAVAVVDPVHVVRSSAAPYVIDLSSITSRHIVPVIERIEPSMPVPKPAPPRG